MEYKTTVLVSDKGNNLNGVIAVEVRNSIKTDDGLIQPLSQYFFLTKEGALQMITSLQHATLALDGVEDYIIHPEGGVHVDGVYYDSVRDYLENKPSQDLN